jgi:hypothetical protein
LKAAQEKEELDAARAEENRLRDIEWQKTSGDLLRTWFGGDLPGTTGATSAATTPTTTAGNSTPTGLAGYQSRILGSTQQMLPQMTDIANTVNAFNLKQKTGQLEQGLPNYGALTAASSGNIGANLRGELPADVRSMLETSAAERAVGQGMPGGAWGSTMPNFDLLRTLGLTSLARKDLGESQLTGAVARTPQVPIYSPSEQFITPSQAAQYDLSLAYLNKPQLGRTGGGGDSGSGGYPRPNITGAPTATPFTQPIQQVAQSGFGAVFPSPVQTSSPDWLSWGSQPMSVSLGGGGAPSELPTYPWNAQPVTAQPWQAPSVWDSGLGTGPSFETTSPFGASIGNYGNDYYPQTLEDSVFDYLDYGG